MRARVVVLSGALLALGLPAVLLTVVRASDPASGRLIRVESFTPLAIPLYAALLLVALVSLFAWRRGRRLARGLLGGLALVGVAGLAAHLSWFSARLTGDNPPPASGAEPLTVMTANLYGGRADGIELVRIASDEHVDVLVVEEITSTELASMEQAGLAALFPHRIGDAGPDFDVEDTMVFSREPLGQAERVGTAHESWLVTVGDPSAGSEQALTLLAVHPYAPTHAGQWRADHAAVLAAAEASGADLVVGDFNATLDHPPMRALAGHGWRSVAELANEGWQPTWPSNGLISRFGVSLPALVQIDHVLVGPRLAGLSTHTVVVPGTDHRAVVAEVARK
ncbi:MAG: hypothetical protein JWN22_973 [Nocardioides sp.]|jgi:endonuclease/exonuclease/phosphatase family metal-dependent hydrolase|nr:hypothetical protein [Nocardioides sp.]